MTNWIFWGVGFFFGLVLLFYGGIRILSHKKTPKRRFPSSQQSDDLESILNELDEMLLDATMLPFTSKPMVDAELLRDLIDRLRLSIPPEIKQARAIAAERREILSTAKQEAEELIRKAEKRARVLVDDSPVVREANAKGMAMLSEAGQKAADMVTQATDRANRLASQANAKATEILTQANLCSEKIRQAAYHSSEETLRSTEATMVQALSEIRAFQQIKLQEKDDN